MTINLAQHPRPSVDDLDGAYVQGRRRLKSNVPVYTYSPCRTQWTVSLVRWCEILFPLITMSSSPLPDYLQHYHLEALQSQQPLYFVVDNVNVTIFPRLPSTPQNATYEAQQYLRIWMHDATPRADLPIESEIISADSENIYQVYG